MANIKFVQLIPLAENIGSDITTHCLLALDDKGDMYMLHIPWAREKHISYMTAPGNIEARKLAIDTEHWTGGAT